MIRKYVFEWYKQEKYGNPIPRTSNITLTKARGDLRFDLDDACQIFMRQNGNFNKIEITKIREFDENNKQIGEDIVPPTSGQIQEEIEDKQRALADILTKVEKEKKDEK